MTLSIREQAAARPRALALVAGDQRLTYAELADRARRVAAGLHGRGLGGPDGAPVALTPRVDVESVVRILGCIDAGVPFVPRHPRLSPDERAAIVRDASVAWEVPEVVAWPDAPAPPAYVPDARALAVLFTSGTSGRPKGAILSRQAFRAAVAASASRLPLGEGDRWLLAMPPAHVGGLSVVLRCVAAHATVVLAPDAEGFDARRIAAAIARERVTHLSLVPTMLDRLLALDPAPDLGTLRAILLGGAPADARLLEEARRRALPVRLTYGLTEACSQVATADEDDLALGRRGARPLPGVDVRVVDGRIEVRGPTLLDGYLGVDRATTFTADGWFPTGDLGRLDADGRLHVEGRRSDLILRGGENVYPAEVEGALLASPGVLAACVFGRPERALGEEVAAALVMAPGLGLEDARLACRDAAARLARFKRPTWVVCVDALPTIGIGKVDRRAVAESAVARCARVDS